MAYSARTLLELWSADSPEIGAKPDSSYLYQPLGFLAKGSKVIPVAA